MYPKFTVSYVCRALMALVALLLVVPVSYAQTDIANKPIAGATTVDVKPNIMLLMDTSKSMGFSHMPDGIETDGEKLPVGYKSAQCNSIYYNPKATYSLPKGSDGVSLPVPDFTAARYDYYSSNVAVVDLSKKFQAYDTLTRANQSGSASDTPQPAYYYVYTGEQTLKYDKAVCVQPDIGGSGMAFAVAADAEPGFTGVAGLWTRSIVSDTSGIAPHVDERENFAIWYTYYRTRMAMTKSSVGLAFAPLTSRFRVGFVSANPGTPVASDKYLAISDFSAANKAAWYAKVNSQVPGGSSPMREGLARVGRHYAGKNNGINYGMPEDPVQYACQKNYTLMTTDGYWNADPAVEKAGPVMIDGTTPVGRQDNTWTNDSGNTPYGVWDGGQTSTRVTINKYNTYDNTALCDTHVSKTTAQISQNTTQRFKSTAQDFRSTFQNRVSTSQVNMSTSQPRIATLIKQIKTVRDEATTTEVRRTTVQTVENTSWTEKYTVTVTKTQTQRNKSTKQDLKATEQMRQATSQTFQTKQRIDETTSQAKATTTQNFASTFQTRIATSRQTASTSQALQSTTRDDQTVKQVRESTSQLYKYDGSTELSTPVGSCVAGGSISCYTVNSGPTLVASCTAADPVAGNNYKTTTCATTTVSGPVAVNSCSPSAASASNSFQTTTCNTVTTTNVPVASCTAASKSSGNNWTATTCPTPNTTGPTPVTSCTPVSAANGPNFVATTCSGLITTGPTPVATCSPASPTSDNNYTTTTCPNVSSGPTPVQSCTAAPAGSGNSWTSTSCNANPTTTSFVTSCSAQTAAVGNLWVGITCPAANTTGPTAVASCTNIAPTSANNYVGHTCTTVTVSARAPIAACTTVLAANGPGYVATICDTVTTGPTNVLYTSCVTNDGSTSPFMRVTCTPNNTAATGISFGTCVAKDGLTSPFQKVICTSAAPTGPTPVASCTNGTSGTFVVTTCTDVAVGTGTTNTVCVAGTDSNGLTTICTPATSGVTNVQPGTCVAGTVGGVTTYCTNKTANNLPIQVCVPIVGTSLNNWVTHTCPGPVTVGPTLVATCSPSGPTTPLWTTTTCSPIVTVSANVPVPTCTAGYNAGTGQTVACQNFTTGPTAFDPAQTCTPIAPDASNKYMTTSCPTVSTGPTGVQSCAPIAASSSNGWKATTCPSISTGPTPVAASSCSAALGNAGNQWVTTSCPETRTPEVPVATCSNIAAGSGNSFTETICTPYNTPEVAVDTCSASSKTAPDYIQTTCRSATTGPIAVPPSACVASSAGVAPDYIDISCTTTTTGPTLVASCTPTDDTVAPYLKTSCPTLTTPPILVPIASCTPAAATGGFFGNAFTSTVCTPVHGSKFTYSTSTTTLTEYMSGTSTITSNLDAPAPVPQGDVDGICYTPGVNTMPLASPPVAIPVTSTCSAWPCVTTSPNVIGGSENSLADVAQYYYVTDLRPDFEDQKIALGTQPLDDRAPGQHMTTFALGLGVSGTLTYDPNYMTSTTGDFARIRPPAAIAPDLPQPATLNWPAWPDPTIALDSKGNYVDQRLYNNAKSIDDFWHAAVNGRGRYFSASDTTAVVDGLGAALNRIDTESGSGGGAGVTTSTPVANNNQGFVTSFKTKEWSGNLTAQRIDVATGTISTTQDWSAQEKLDAMTFAACDNRTILMRKAGATNNLTNFSWDTKACVAGVPSGSADTGLDSTQKAMFGPLAVASLGQYPAMTNGGPKDQRGPAAGANMVNFIRGQRGFEVPADAFVPNDPNYLYRKREHVLGDIVGSVATYVGGPVFSYADSGYGAYKTTNAARTPMIYVGANDGMLHAIYAPILSTDPNYANAGTEAWAYVPQAVIPNLYQLADVDYKANHRFFVDGTPAYGDVYDAAATAWKTILVGGLNAGGKSYYALDVTDPVHPKSLWEFSQGSNCFDANNTGTSTTGTDCHLGLSFGRPIITKLVDGTWVVLLTSGYNNLRSPTGTGDGHGYLYVLNAITGQIISKLDTGVGTTTSPSGLRELNNYVANGALDNTTLRVYGGDLYGNIWRFDVNDNLAPVGKEATLVATAKDASGLAQPITTRLQLAEVNGNTMIVAATGQLLGSSDTSTTQVQSIYGFVDLLGASSPYTDLRGSLRTVNLTQTTTTRKTSCSGATNCAQTNGWVLDLPESGERINVDPFIVAGTLVFVSNVPSNSACQAGGHSWINFLGLLTGMAAASSADDVASMYLADSLSVGVGFVVLPDGRVIATSVGSDASVTQKEVPVEPPNPIGRRVSWREIKK